MPGGYRLRTQTAYLEAYVGPESGRAKPSLPLCATGVVYSRTLALPMLDQGALHGFALLGTKPDNANYRPDEIENLAWAAHQVGLDLQALQARELRDEVARLNAKNASLNDKVAWLEDKTAESVLQPKPQTS